MPTTGTAALSFRLPDHGVHARDDFNLKIDAVQGECGLLHSIGDTPLDRIVYNGHAGLGGN